eukprot:CAMPEP_0201918770 /NCGR_PEP_ID=MMETSP0903-20130614/7834_1 /ASSEMBLY_ACC=CAM_ASM_000552 /TAXON_ID=420261 /ORGANISM="Thalassiosira antarctica, Strain CCMP982" /LENGTH=1230 /DNA_ID=CAMNT_0048455143 /DNA_START=36 /DNA_END=3725 /DNA_ORIENTATION=+
MTSNQRRVILLRPLLLLPCLLLLPTITHSQDDSWDNWDWEPKCPDGFSGYRSAPDCKAYFICNEGTVASPTTQCNFGLIFNEFLSVCDFDYNFECGSTRPPSGRPTKRPTVSPTARAVPTTPNPTLPPNTRSPSANLGIEDALEFAKKDINRKLFVYQSGWSDWIPSTQYRYDGFLRGLQVMYLEGVGDMTFYLGEDVSGMEGTKVGLVNIAAFLSQSMKETIKYNACDENNWDVIDGTYPLSNACGQLEQSYQDYSCPPGTEHMQCDVDPTMTQKANTQANWYGAPGPLFCGPTSKYPFVGYWDYSHTCDFPWKDPPEYCTDYEGQKGGKFVNEEAVENRNGRTDVEGCCWWGRGVIQTTGICNFGMLNYYLGKRAADEGRDSRYPHIDFCKDPGAVCSREDHPELKWIAGMFYWIRSLQTYDEGWNYFDNLKSFVRGGMTDDAFIDAVSGIVNRGCHNPPCGSGPLDGGYERKENFKKVLEVLLEEDGSPRVYREDDMPTFMPSLSPTKPKVAEVDAEDEDEDENKIITPGPTPPPIKIITPGPTPPPTLSSDYENNEALVNDQVVTAEWADGEEKDDEEEDWSETGSSSAMNLLCGETQYDAFENCGRNGYDCLDGVCHNGLKCFMVGDACDDNEEEKIDTRPPTARPTPKPTPKPTSRPSAPLPSAKESPGITPPAPAPEKAEPTPVNNIGLRQQYCSKSKAALPTTCITAKTCKQSEDCPSGTYCWADHLCGTKPPTLAPMVIPSNLSIPTYMPTWTTYMPTNPPPEEPPQPDDTSIQFDVTDTFFCGTDRSQASTSCHKRCRSGNREDCEDGETCFGYTSCEVETPRAPAVEESEPTKEPTKEPITPPPTPNTKNGPDPPGIEPTQKPTPSPTTRPTNEESDASQPTTPAVVQQLFCASAMSELEASCESAQSCNSGPCPSGMFCFPFTCTQMAGGEESPPAAAVFDASSDEKPAPVENQRPAPAGNEQQPATPGENQQYLDLCPQSSFVGWHTSADCKEYYKCDNGAPGVIHVCETSLKFDKVRNECQSEQSINSYCYGPPLLEDNNNNNSQGAAQQQGGAGTVSASRGLCKERYTGWEARLGCREYFWCDQGHADFIYDCGEDLLFDRSLELCNFAHLVHCVDKGGPATPPPVPPTPRPVARQTFPPTTSESPSSVGDIMIGSNNNGSPSSVGDGGVGSNNGPSDTAAPTLSLGQSESPPWLMNVVMTKNSGVASSNIAQFW